MLGRHNKFRRVLVIIPIGILVACLSGVYIYYFELSHTILEKREGKYTIVAKCEADSVFTFIARVDVYIDAVKVLDVAVNEGYDTLGHCMISAVKAVKFSKDRKSIDILTENQTVKTARIVYLPRY